MASQVAEAYVAIKTNTEALSAGLAKAKTLSVAGVKGIATGATTVLKTGFNVAWAGTGLAAKGAALAASTAWNQAKNTLNKAKESAAQLAGVFKLVGVALLGIALTADTSGVRVNAMLRGSGGAAGFSKEQLAGMAAEIANTSGASQRLVREAQAIMLSFGAVRGDTFREAMKSVPDLAAALGTDLPNAARTLGQALQSPAQGLEMLKSLGVTITPIMSEAFTRAAEGSQAGWQRAQQYILQAVKNASKGSAAELDGTLAGAVTRIKNGFIDMADGFAPVLIPAAKGLVDVMNQIKAAVNANKPAFEAFGNGLAMAVGVVGKVVGFIINLIGKIPPQVLAGVAAFVAVGTVVAGVAAVVAKVIVFIKPILGLLFAILNPLNIITATVIALGLAVAYAFNTERWGGRVRAALAGIIGTIQKVWEKIQTLGTVIWNRVQPHWDKFVERAVSIFETISAFISENEETWTEWVGLIGEIWGGVFATVVQVWDMFVGAVQAGLKWVGDNSGITWDGIKTTVTAVLDTLSLVWSNFGLSLKIGWTAIAYAAVVAWDWIADIFWKGVASATGAGASMVAAFSATWNNIQAGMERMANAVRATLAAVGAAAQAALRGRNPVTAFRESYEREVARLNGNSREFRDVGEAAASAYRRGYDRVLEQHPPGASDEQRRLRERLGELNGELNAGRRAQREKDEEAQRRREGGAAAAARGGAAAGSDVIDPANLPTMIKVKIENIGLTDLYKKVQESITGGGTVALQQQQARGIDQINRETRDQTGILNDINRGVREGRPAVVT